MQTQTERHEFSRLPLTVSGGTAVAHVSGECMWRRKDDGTLIMVRDLCLRGADGEIVEVTSEDELWTVIFNALANQAKGLRHRSPRGDGDYKPEVDSEVTEGARS